MGKQTTQYLVNLCHAMDDVPMGLFDDMDDAFLYANNLEWDVPAEYLRRLELPDCNTPCVITITTFQNGLPVSRVVVRDYECEVEQ